ncbi:MAG: hypothetical protein Q9170_003934 [Blastenia crenularia]
MTREKLPYGHLHLPISAPSLDRTEENSSPARDYEFDIHAPPESLSSKSASPDLDVPLHEPDTPPPRKRRKLGPPNEQRVDLTSPSEVKYARGNGDSTSPQRSNIRASTFTSLDPLNYSNAVGKNIPYPRRSSQQAQNDESEDVFAQFHSSQSKAKKQYQSQPTRNFHKAAPTKVQKKPTKHGRGKAEETSREGPQGFKNFDPGPLYALNERPSPTDTKPPSVDFKTPPVLSGSPRSERATRRSAKNVKERQEPPADKMFKKPPRPPSPEIKKLPPPQFVVPQTLSPVAQDRRSSRSNESSQSLIPLDAINLETIKAKLNVQFEIPASSAALSSGPSFEFDYEGSKSSSSLSSAPDVEDLDVDEFHKEWTESHPPGSPEVQCPICKAFVPRRLMEEFSRSGLLSVRQQVQFCKAHKFRSAEDVWRERGYPNIDWRQFSDRLPKYGAELSSVLNGTRSSFYRNVFEDEIKCGANRNLKQSLLSGNGSDERHIGYYGTKGARIIMEYIMATFASRIRRLAGTDKLISTSGVSGFVQGVLAPELAVMLVKDDMHVDEEQSRVILKESSEIGNLLNEEEDEAIKDEEEDSKEVL